MDKVLVIGLDSGTFRLIKPFARGGCLPNLSRAMRQGVTRTLKSTMPPISPPAWTSFLTGNNPGRHGIFHFYDIDARNYNFSSNRLINSTLFSGRTFLDVISQKGGRVGAVKIPFTYPPWEVNGFMVAGEPSPNWRQAFTFPENLAEKIGRTNLGTAGDFVRYNAEELVKHLIFDCGVRTRIACDMLEEKNYDFFMVVHTITDAASHRFWKYTDASCPNYSRGFEENANLIRDVYVEADKSIGRILGKVDTNTTVFFMSDHGASRKPVYFFDINEWLRQKGYLAIREENTSAQHLHRMLIGLKRRLPVHFRQTVIRGIKSHFQEKLSAFQTSVLNIDWMQTKVYAVNLYNCMDGIIVNLKGRQSEGIVASTTAAAAMCKEIRDDLMKIRDPRNGKSVVDQVWQRGEVFNGPHTERMPDLIIRYNADYRSSKGTKGALFSDVPASDFDFQSGDHDEDGIFIAVGPNVRKGLDLESAHIQDMAPTILYAMGLQIPHHMEGRVLVDIFDESVIGRRPVERISADISQPKEQQELSEEEQEKMKEQLRGLGYL